MTGSGTLKALGTRSIVGAFNKRLEEVTQASWVSQLAMMIDTNVETETIGFLSDTPMMRERVSGRPAKTLRPYTFSITNKEFSAGIEVKEADWRRDKTGQIAIRARELGARAAQLPQSVISQLIIDNGNAYDGVAMWHATNHITQSGFVVNNAIQVAAATGTIPTDAEMATAILSGCKQIISFKDDENEPRNEFAKSFTLMVPVDLWPQAQAAIGNEFLAAGQSNTLRTSGLRINLVMNPRLTSSVLMFLFRDDSDVKALVWQDEVLPAMRSLTEGSEYATINSRFLFLADRTGNGGYGRFDQTCRIEFT